MPGTKDWYCGIGMLDGEIVVFATAYNKKPVTRFATFIGVETPVRRIETYTGITAANKYLIDLDFHPTEVQAMYVAYEDGTIKHANVYDWTEDCGWQLREGV